MSEMVMNSTEIHYQEKITDGGGDTIRTEANSSTDPDMHVVTAFCRNRGEVLLLRRSTSVETYPGRWGGVSGYAEGAPDEQVLVEIAEETGLEADVTLVRSAPPLEISDGGLDRHWIVYPYLFDSESRDVTLSEEHDRFEWVSPTRIFDPDRDCVPSLWATYDRVAPTSRSIAADTDHGAAWLSIRALEVLRDRAGLLIAERDSTSESPSDEWDELSDLAARVIENRPSMAVLRNRVNRVMTTALEQPPPDSNYPDATHVHDSALEEIGRSVTADESAAANATKLLSGNVLTHSWSGTVIETLRTATVNRVFVAESRPECEGIDTAKSLADHHDVTVHTDAAVGAILHRYDVDTVLVGADTILPDGRILNKTGTRTIALVAANAGIPLLVVASADKISADESVSLESGTGAAIYDGNDDGIDVTNPTFDVTPPEYVTSIVTERGVLDPDDVSDIAISQREFERWQTM